MKAKRGKCLALAAVLAMVVCAFAIAMPAGETDAADPQADVKVPSGSIAEAGEYYISTESVTITASSGTVNLYLKQGVEMKYTCNANGATINVYMATSEVSGGKVSYADGLVVTGQADTAIKFADGKITTTLTVSEYGVKVVADSASTYYPAGADVGTVPLSKSNESVSVMNGSAVVTIQNGSDGTVLSKIKLDKVVSSVAVAVAGSDNGAMKVSGGAENATGGITMQQGQATIDSSLTLGNMALNAFAGKEVAKNVVLSATASWGTGPVVNATYVYGSVASNQSITVGNKGLTFLNASVTALTVSGCGDATASLSVVGSGNLTNRGDSRYPSGYVANVTGADSTFTLISGNFYYGTDLACGNTVVVAEGASLVIFKSLELKGTMTVSGKLLDAKDCVASFNASTITVKGAEGKNAVLRAFAGAEIGQYLTIAKEGDYAVVDISNAQQVELVEGTKTRSDTFPQNQVVTVRENSSYTVSGTGVVVTIKGGLNVPEGTELIITGGAKVVVDGDMASVKIDGTLTIDKYSELEIKGQGTVISGAVASEGIIDVDAGDITFKSGAIASSAGTIDVDKDAAVKVEAGAMVVLGGTVKILAMSNAGYVELNEAVLEVGSTISLVADEAVANIVEVTLDSDKGLTVNDVGLTCNGGKWKPTGVNSAVFSATGKTVLTGVEVSSTVVLGTTEAYTYKYLDIEGSAFVDSNAATITLSGGYNRVAESLVLGKGVTLAFNTSAALTVIGELTALDGTIGQNVKGTIYVYGLVQSKEALDTAKVDVNGVYYKAADASKSIVYCYSSLAGAIDAGAGSAEILGDITLLASDEIPSGMTLKIASGNSLTVGSTTARDVVLTVLDGAKLAVEGTVTVMGSVEIENVKESRDVSKIASDVKVTDDVSALFTNIYTAMSTAETGDIVEITSTAAVELDSSITVKEGVTLYVPAGKSLKIADGKKITITVNGVLVSYSGITGFKDSGSTMKVAGEFLTAETGYSSDMNTEYNVDGAYYTVTDASGTYWHITTLENAAEDAQLTNAIYVYGKVTVGDISVEGKDSGNGVSIVIELKAGAELTAGTIDLDNAALNVLNDKSEPALFSGTVAGLNGSVVLKNVTNTCVAVADDDAGVPEMSIHGGVSAEKDAGTSVTIASGTVTIFSGKSYTVSGYTVFAVAENATLDVEGALTANQTVSEAGAFCVDIAGTITVENGGDVDADFMFVTGTLNVLAAATGKTAGTVTADTIFVGFSAKEVKTSSDVGAAGTVSAPKNAVDAETIYVKAGSTVSADVLSAYGDRHTAYNLEGTELFTIYTQSTTMTVGDARIAPSIAGAKIDGWKNATKLIGEVASVEAVVDYDVYKVSFVADYGFADIFIDGEKVASVANGKIVYVDPVYDDKGVAQDYILLDAKAHTIDWTIKSGYDGSKAAAAFDGKSVSKSFTITTSMDWKNTTYKMVLSGVTQQEPVTPTVDNKDDGMGITDYLLIVLVVLIAVMAIMVALRLMRS